MSGDRAKAALVVVWALLAAGVLLVAVELADGASKRSKTIANPCLPRAHSLGSGLDATVQRVVLDGLDGAACNLGTSRERLVLALVGDSSERLHWSRQRIELAVRGGLRRSLDQAAKRGEVPAFALPVLQRLIRDAPLDQLIRGAISLNDLLGG